MNISDLSNESRRLVILYEFDRAVQGFEYFYLHGDAGKVENVINLRIDAGEQQMFVVLSENGIKL
jgi:hypothetical protein